MSERDTKTAGPGMSESGFVRFRPAPLAERKDADALRGKTLTEDEIEAAAQADPDNPPLTPKRLANLKRIPLAKATRYRTGLTQQGFADVFGFSLGRLRDLEQGRTEPDSAIVAYLGLIRADPEAVRRMLESARSAA